MSRPPLGIGSVVWWRDENCRKHEQGLSYPTERGYWREATIVGESPRKWLLSGYAGKLPKSGAVPMGYATSLGGLEKAIWFNEHKYAVAESAKRIGYGLITDFDAAYEKLKAVAEITDYKVKAPS